MTTNQAADVLRRIAFLLERSREPIYRVRAFRTAAEVADDVGEAALTRRAADSTLTELRGIGPRTAEVIAAALAGEQPEYLRQLEAATSAPLADGGADLRAKLRGDLHSHSNWSDGGTSIKEMVAAAASLGHEYLALTDHSPRLTVANGLSAERLEEQLDVVAKLNAAGQGATILTGIEVDINEDGSIDQTDDLLSRLDVVVASVHSKLRMPGDEMTERMVRAIANPHVDILGHCTGRLITGGRGTRPESQFDAELVFAACVQFGVAVEINSRPERLDPPRRLLEQAVEAGCYFSIDSDAHAPGQLDWQPYGCARAEACGVPPDRVINTMPVDELRNWTTPR